MSVKIMSLVFENEELGSTERLVLLALADHANDEGVCYPSVARLCRRTGLKERAVQGKIKALVEGGYLTVEKNAGPRGSNMFQIHITPAEYAPPQNMHPRTKRQSPPQDMRGTPARDAPEPSKNHQEPSKERAPTFSEFWDAWPLTKTGKQKAEVAFKRLSEQNRASAVHGAAHWAKQWREKYPTASDIHPATYLNGKRWEDEFTAARRTFTAPAATTGAHIPSAAIERTAPPPEDMSRFQKRGNEG